MGLTRLGFVRAMVFNLHPIVGTHCGAHEIRLCESNGVQSTSKFLPGSRWFLGSLIFIANKFGDLNLQEPKSQKVIMLGTVHLPTAPV
jgi:hypothetical protein